MTRRVVAFSSVFLSAVLAFGLVGGSAHAQAGAGISLEPSTVAAGDPFTVKVVGFCPPGDQPGDATIDIVLSGPEPSSDLVEIGKIGETQIDEEGNASATFPAPDTPGAYDVFAEQPVCEGVEVATLEVTAAETTTTAPETTAPATTTAPSTTVAAGGAPVTNTPTAPPALPATGHETQVMVWLALAVLLGGFGLTVVARRS